MNTVIYRAFAEELVLIKQAQLDLQKESGIGSVIGQGGARAGEAISSTGRKAISGIRRIFGSVQSPPVRPAPATMGVGSFKTMAATPRAAAQPNAVLAAREAPVLTPAAYAKTQAPSRPPGVGSKWRMGIGTSSPEDIAAAEAGMKDWMQQVQASRYATAQPGAARAQLPLGKRRLYASELDPATFNQLRLFRLRAQAGLPAPRVAA
jgi:hypothetical protein